MLALEHVGAIYASCQPGGSRGVLVEESASSDSSSLLSQGNACSSFSQRPKSLSRHRSLQNGTCLLEVSKSTWMSHVGHRGPNVTSDDLLDCFMVFKATVSLGNPWRVQSATANCGCPPPTARQGRASGAPPRGRVTTKIAIADRHAITAPAKTSLGKCAPLEIL